MTDTQQTPRRILVVEDDPDIPDLLGIHLGDLGYEMDHVSDGRKGYETALEGGYDLLVLDLMLPGMDGLEVCRRLREEKLRLPILMLTARSEEMDKVLGLELGADDYLTKPFSIRELIARIRAIFRRMETLLEPEPSGGEGDLEFDGLTIHPESRQAALIGRPVDLTSKEFDLLHFLASRPGRAYNRQELLDHVWGYQFTGYEHTVNSHINRLRAKIEADPSEPRYILTVWGYGYRFASREELAT